MIISKIDYCKKCQKETYWRNHGKDGKDDLRCKECEPKEVESDGVA